MAWRQGWSLHGGDFWRRFDLGGVVAVSGCASLGKRVRARGEERNGVVSTL